MTALIIVLAIILIIVIWWIVTGNQIRRLAIGIDTAQADITIYLKKRYDVLTSSAEIVKKYTKHETEIFSQLIEIRRGMTPEELVKADQEQAEAVHRFLAVGEAYPELKSAELYRGLQDQLSEENNHLAASKRMYNASISAFNKYIVQFPMSLIAGTMNAHPLPFLKEEDGEKYQNVKLDL